MSHQEGYAALVEEALRILGVKSFVLGIQDPSFPSSPGDDTGRGSPYSPTGIEFTRLARGLGFNGLQFGPQGLTPGHTPSPYEGTLFSRSDLSISLAALVEEGLLPREDLEDLVRARPPGGEERVPYPYVRRGHEKALRKAFATFTGPGGGDDSSSRHEDSQRSFAGENASWLERDALYDLLRRRYGKADWREWRGGDAALDRSLFAPEAGTEGRSRERIRWLMKSQARAFDFYSFVQYLAHSQHGRFREAAAGMGLKLYGDFQVGFSDADSWSCRSLFLPRYLMGAPPSRTNPEGQPWGYPVLNPLLYRTGAEPGPVAVFLARRMEKMFREYDAVRIDHPHGLVCPWVYRGGTKDPLRAVQGGARLFSSPSLPDHPELAPFAIPAEEQLESSSAVARHADDRVRELTPAQVDEYALLFDVLVKAAADAGSEVSALVPEVLSTLPYPLERVLERHGLGRFRVTQKADLRSGEDVYRSENARPRDWIMVGNHDTKPLWLLLEEWEGGDRQGEWAEYLAARLFPRERGREDLRRQLLNEPSLLAQAQFADLFASPAENVMVFFTDLFGMKGIYNRPGVVSPSNWSLRLPADYAELYRRRLRENRAFNIPRALALALGTREGTAAREVAAGLAACSEGPPFPPFGTL